MVNADSILEHFPLIYINQITIDQALIIKTKDNVYSFYKDWMYSEVINITVDRNEETVYSEEKVYNEWSDNGTDHTEIKRTRKVL